MYDLERFEYWAGTGSRSIIQKAFIPTEIDCDFLINFWNLFDDIHYSCNSVFESVITKRSGRCYNKLFYGLNLHSITKKEYTYNPIFTQKELKFTQTLMKQGIDFLRDNSEYLD